VLKYVYPSEHRDEVRQTAKMMRHTSAIVAVPSQADTRLSSIGVTWSTNALGGMFLTLWIARLPLSHGPIVLRSPLNGSEARM
jgi:hypothetical protein